MDESVNRILVTGASGFIGRALCEKLIRDGREVRVLLRNPEQLSLFGEPAQPGFAVGDLGDKNSLINACRGVTTIVHLAGIAHVNNFTERELRRVNLDGTRNLLEAGIQNDARRFLFISSSLAQAAASGAAPATNYGIIKLETERLVRQAQSRGDIDATILRPVNVYGAGMGGNMATMISLIARRRLPPLPQLDSRTSMVGVADLITAIELVLKDPASYGKTYLVSDGEEYRIAALEASVYGAFGRKKPGWQVPPVVLYGAAVTAEMVNKLSGRRGGIGAATYRNLTTDSLFSTQAIGEELGFKPTTTFYRELPAIVAAMGL